MDQPTCSCDYQDTAYIARSCGSSLNVTLFMTLVDVMLRTQCDLADPCGRASSSRVRNLTLEYEYDFVVIGGGVAGPVVAGRLSENPKWKVLLLEAGPDEPTVTSVPGFAASAVGTHLDWKYNTEKNKNACLITGGICRWPRGKMLAGTGAMTGMMYTRSHQSIYDEWERQGNPGWGFSEVLKYFIKSENNQNPDLVETGFHGFDGPLKVQRFSSYPPIGEDIIKAGQELGYASGDFNGENQIGVNFAQVMCDKGVRSSTPRMYLRDKYEQGNLKVQLNAHVMKINIDPVTKRALSVQFKDMNTNEIKTVKAGKEIILTAGAIGSPQLLMLSGVGPKAQLDKVGIETISDLRVGYNLVHHVGANLKFTIRDNDLRALDFDNLNDYLTHRNGSLAHTGLTQLTGFFRSRFSKIRDIQVFFDGYSTDCSYTGYNEECNSGNLMKQQQNKYDSYLSKVRSKYKSANQSPIRNLMMKYFENFLQTRMQRNMNIRNELDNFLNTLIQLDESANPIVSNQQSIKTEMQAMMETLGGLENVEITKSISLPIRDSKSMDSRVGLLNKNEAPMKFQASQGQDSTDNYMNTDINEIIEKIQHYVRLSEAETANNPNIERNFDFTETDLSILNDTLLPLLKVHENKGVENAHYFEQMNEGMSSVKESTDGMSNDGRSGRSIITNPFNYLFASHNEEDNDKIPCGRRIIYARPTNLLPISRGRIVLNSSDPFDYPKIHSNYLVMKQDVDVIIDGIRIVQKLIRTKALQKWDFQMDTTRMPECKQYQWDSDGYWRCFIKTYTLPENHPGGTCKMGPADDFNSVVDPQLRVLGVSNLRVMDASIFPTNINSNPIATIIMIAEKGADFVKDSWK